MVRVHPDPPFIFIFMTQLLSNNDATPPSRVFFVVVLSAFIMIGWQIFFDKPAVKNKTEEKKIEIAKAIIPEEIKIITRSESLLENINISDFSNEFVSGRINKVGATIDSLIFNKYKYKIDSDKSVFLLSPSDTKYARYVSFGWISDDVSADLPTIKTIWKDNGGLVSDVNGKVLSWKNKDGIEFFISLIFDDKYMLTVKKYAVNNSKKDLHLMPYTKIKRDVTDPSKDTSSYEGPVIVHENSMKEADYSKIKKSGGLDYIEDEKHCIEGQHNWAGFSDKYWLSAILFDCNLVEKVSFRAYTNGNRKYIQSDVLENSMIVESGKKSIETTSFVYLGAKDISSLDDYSAKYSIKLFDKSIDFGMFYFLTKPILLMLRFIHKFVDNYGLAIIFLTLVIRIALLPLGNKSYRMMGKMKSIQPKVDALKTQFGDDKMAMNKAMIELYKKEKVNPFATFIPILIQIPIFFALYKVLYISIEIRQSPFIWWIYDLSAPDPTTIFNLFGLLPFGVPGFLQVGVLPIVVGITMWLQQVMSHSGPQNEYTKVMKYMPIFFTFLFASFPAGLMIYWSVNNLFSIANQYIVSGKK